MSSKSQKDQSDLGSFYIKKDSSEQTLKVGSLFKRSRENEVLGPKKFKSEELSFSATSDNLPSTSNHIESKAKDRTKKYVKLLEGVVFVLSGFKNPERSQIRDAAKKLGAVFSTDWTDSCTHLICAFKNTPKYRQVLSQGCIVSKEWVFECSKQQKHLPERRFKLGKVFQKIKAEEEEEELSDDDFVVGDDEIEYDSEEEEEEDYDDDSNIEEDCVKKKFAKDESTKSSEHEDFEGMLRPAYRIKKFLQGLKFFIYGNFSSSQTHFLSRYITAYGGVLSAYMSDDVRVVFTNVPWDCNFDEAVKDNKDLTFLRVDWLLDCINQQRLLPFSSQVLKP